MHRATNELALRAMNDVRLQLTSGEESLSREQVRMAGVIGATLKIFREEGVPYDIYVDKIISGLEEVLANDPSDD